MITNLKTSIRYKAPEGQVTRRTTEHFVSRSVLFDYNGIGQRMDIPKDSLPLAATQEDVEAYIEANIDKASVADPEKQRMQEQIDMLTLTLLGGGL